MRILHILAALAILSPSISTASLIAIDFHVTGFITQPPVITPTDPVIGQIIIESPTLTSPPTSIHSVSLTLDGYTYSLRELGFDTVGNSTAIGGAINTPWAMVSNTNDFWLHFDHVATVPKLFIYSSRNYQNRFFESVTFASFRMTPLNVPESQGYFACIVLCAAMLAVIRRHPRRGRKGDILAL
jgi:hypothetical protein